MLKYYTFYIDLSEDKFDYVETVVKSYINSHYLIAYEHYNSKGELKPHFHFIVYCEVNQKNNIYKKILTDHKLFVKGKGGYRPYGMLKKPIRDPQRLKAYCMKDKNVRTNLPDEELQELAKISFKITDNLQILKEKFISEIKNGNFKHKIQQLNGWGINTDFKQNIQLYVIKFILDNKLTILRSSIDRWSLLFLREHPDICEEVRQKYIYHFIYN